MHQDSCGVASRLLIQKDTVTELVCCVLLHTTHKQIQESLNKTDDFAGETFIKLMLLSAIKSVLNKYFITKFMSLLYMVMSFCNAALKPGLYLNKF